MANKTGNRTGFTLVELLVAIIIVGILASMAVAMQGGAINKARMAACKGNLSNLYKGVYTYIALYGGSMQSPPKGDDGAELKGSELWVKLCTDPTDVLEQDNAGKDAKILQCPVEGDGKGPDYRGPKNGFTKTKKYMGCDIDGNHGKEKYGGNALTRNGAVSLLTGDDWDAAIDETSGLQDGDDNKKKQEPPPLTEEDKKELEKEIKRLEGELTSKQNVFNYELNRIKKALEEKGEETEDELIRKVKDIAGDIVKAVDNLDKAKKELAEAKESLANAGKPRKIIYTRRMRANEEDAAGALKQVVSHEATWQRVDEDDNGIKDYYTFDVAGLHYHTNMSGAKLQYIDIKFANADPSVTNWDKDAKHEPCNGYYFKAIVKDGNGNNYNENLAVRAVGPIKVGTPIANSFRYGFCAYPAVYGKTGKFTFIVNQAGVRFKKDTGGKPIDQWPCNEGFEPTKQGWEVVD